MYENLLLRASPFAQIQIQIWESDFGSAPVSV